MAYFEAREQNLLISMKPALNCEKNLYRRLLPMELLRAVLQVRTIRTSEVDYNGREYCDTFSPRILGSQESHTILNS